jgi:hypothetical protein
LKVEVLKQFSVFMPNRPGALARLARLISDRGINVLGIASEVRDDSGMVRLAVSQTTDLSSILSGAGFASVETSLISVEVTDQPGELARLTQALAEGKVNITTVYGTSVGGNSSRILINVESTERARVLLERLQNIV